jgi:hypothetical protein
MSLLYSARFSGSNYLSIANFTGNPAALSVSCWVYLNASQVSRIFFSDYTGWAPGISDSSTNQIKFYLGSATLTSPTVLTNNTWYHAVFTHDGTTAKVYLNGNPTPNASTATGLTYGSVPASNWIGSLNGSIQMLNGKLAGVGYWSRAINTTEVASLYNGGNGLAGSELSGSLLTSLGSYHDFINAASLGTDSSGNGRTFTNNGTVAQGFGPVSPITAYAGLSQPATLVLNPAWSSGLVRAQVFPAASGTSFPDVASGATYSASGSIAWTTNAFGNCLNPNDSTGDGTPNLLHPIAASATQFTMSSLVSLNTLTGLTNRHLWSAPGTPTDMRLVLNSGLLQFQCGADGAFTNLTCDPPPLNALVVITCRLAVGGVRSIWYGPIKVAERTDVGCVYGTSGTNSLGLGSAVGAAGQNWSGQINGGHVATRAWTDAEIVSLASDFFAPVRLPSGAAALLPAM